MEYFIYIFSENKWNVVFKNNDLNKSLLKLTVLSTGENKCFTLIKNRNIIYCSKEYAEYADFDRLTDLRSIYYLFSGRKRNLVEEDKNQFIDLIDDLISRINFWMLSDVEDIEHIVINIQEKIRERIKFYNLIYVESANIIQYAINKSNYYPFMKDAFIFKIKKYLNQPIPYDDYIERYDCLKKKWISTGLERFFNDITLDNLIEKIENENRK